MKSLIVAFFFFLTFQQLHGQRWSRDLNLSVITNQVGYTPNAAKTCVVNSTNEISFDVIDVTNGKVAYHGKMVPEKGDFGTFAKADFSNLKSTGHYYIKADTLRSYPFAIANDVYQSQINDVVGYFSKQRCGASTTGYLTPCHTDDGIRFDNGQHKDVSGGWHDASDLRKWVSATLYGVLGLARAYDLQPAQYRNKILDEIRWGNQYFLKMQEPEGFVMDFVGGDLLKHSDNNRWTDNIINQKGTGIELVTPNAGSSSQLMLASKEHDDRIIQTRPVEMMAQYNFIAAEAMVARITSTNDKVYSKKCLDAAKNCYAYCLKHDKDTSTGNAGAALQASIELYKLTKDPMYKKRATDIAKALHDLQVNDTEDVSGFFKVSFTDDEPYKNIWNGCQAFIGLSDLATLFPNDKDANAWKEVVENYARKYLLHLSSMNSFDIVPWGLYTDKDPGGNRKTGKYWYRYFMQPEGEWWVGVNSNVASAGVGLLKAAKVLKDEKLRAAAQKQLDWIFGSNPYSSSTMVGTGYNHPKHFPGSSFSPTVPLIDGAVVNGIGGDHDDMPTVGNGDWQVSEYWTPMVAYTLWLMAEISGH